MSDAPPPPDDQSPPPPPPPDLSPPPGYTEYANAPTPGEPVRRVRGIAVGLLITTGLVSLLGLVGPLLMLGLRDEAQTFLLELDGPNADAAEESFRDSLSSLSAFNLVLGPVQLATAILTMLWMYRLSKNVRAYGRQTVWSPLFAFFGWFLPPLLFVIPLLMLRELWSASSPLPTTGTDSWKKGSELPALWVWFALFGVLPLLLVPVMGLDLAVGFVGDLESLAERIDDNANVLLLNGLGSFLAGIAWMVVVRRMTDRHTGLTNES